MAKETIPIQSLLKKHLRLFIEDLIVPVRVVVATSLVFIIFLLADQALFYVIDLTSAEMKTRIPFVGWLLDAIQVLSLVAVSVYFVVSGISNLQTQWKITQKIETKAGLK